MLMTAVRIAHAEPMPGRTGKGEFHTRGHLVVLADDAGHRAVPIWLRDEPGQDDLSQLVELARRPAGEIIAADAPEELTARLLRAAGAGVTGVDIDVTAADVDELSPRVTVARVRLSGSAGPRQIAASLGLGLAMAAASGAPVRVPDAVMDRLAVPVTGEDLLTPFLDRVPPVGRARPGRGPAEGPMDGLPGQRPRFEPRNLDFSDGLDRWDLESGFALEDGQSRSEDYSAAADGRSAVLSAGMPRPAGSAALVQTIFADDYRGATVTFGGEIRTQPRPVQAGTVQADTVQADTVPAGPVEAGLRLEVFRHWWRTGRGREDHRMSVSGSSWNRHEITALVPEDADLIRFGITLAGPGQVTLRNPELRASEAGHLQPGPR
jgi:hypothetical protein